MFTTHFHTADRCTPTQLVAYWRPCKYCMLTVLLTVLPTVLKQKHKAPAQRCAMLTHIVVGALNHVETLSARSNYNIVS